MWDKRFASYPVLPRPTANPPNTPTPALPSLTMPGREAPRIECTNTLGRIYLLTMSDAIPSPPQSASNRAMASDQLLPLVYEELRKLAAAMLSHEKPGQILDATGLVHEAYIRLAADKKSPLWDNAQHFFVAAANTMRRILVELARQKLSLKNGGSNDRLDVDLDQLSKNDRSRDLLAIDDALSALSVQEPVAARLVVLHYFVGLTLEEAAATLQISVRTAYRYLAYARERLHISLDLEADLTPLKER